MTNPKQPARRNVQVSNPEVSQATYEQLIGSIKLARVWITKMDFALETTCNPPKEYQMQIGRSQADVEIHDQYLCIALGFEIKGKNEEDYIFTGHYHFAIIFEFSDQDQVESLLENDDIRNTFLGAQADKIVWSYLRKALQQILLDAGLPAVVLPLYM